MPDLATILVHESQFPGNVRRDLLDSLRSGEINPRFHYESPKQAQRWLALHEQFSPARRDADCLATYQRCFRSVAKKLTRSSLHVIGLGCGGGQKDAQLLQLLTAAHKRLSYAPCDVSVPLVLTARDVASAVIPRTRIRPFVCDLAKLDDFSALRISRSPALITFFGMIPNMEPQIILPRFNQWLRADDLLLFGANLAPGLNYDAGIKKILPQYDNKPTRDWLMTFLLDLGVETRDGKLKFLIETDPAYDLKRVAAIFQFTRARQIRLDAETIRFRAGQSIRLFFSYRYTVGRVKESLNAHGIDVLDYWKTESGEEGVFLCRRGAA